MYVRVITLLPCSRLALAYKDFSVFKFVSMVIRNWFSSPMVMERLNGLATLYTTREISRAIDLQRLAKCSSSVG